MDSKCVAANAPPKKRRISKTENSTRDWSTAPLDVLALIATKINLIEDYVRFGATCRLWHAAAKSITPEPQRSPWLMVAAKDDLRFRSSVYGFYRFAAGALEIQLPQLRDMMCSLCSGSPFGWLFTKSRGFTVNLFNPLSKDLLPLPKLPDTFVFKAILTANPRSPHCLVFVIYSTAGKLGFSKPGGSEWSFIQSQVHWEDVVRVGGNLYGCSSTGQVYEFDFSSPQVKVVEFAAPPRALPLMHRKYLVDLGGELCLVIRKHMPNDHFTRGFNIYKFNKRWSRMLSLGRHCLFVGGNYTFSAEACGQFKPNCVYYTDSYPVYFNNDVIDAKSRGYDAGVYHVGDRTKEPLLARPTDSGSLESYPTPLYHEPPDADNFIDIPPIWIIPSLR